MQFPIPQDRGLILNIDNFPGTVEISNSYFNKNMVYIKDILIKQNESGQDSFNEFFIHSSKFRIKEGGDGIVFSKCDSASGKTEYLFQIMNDVRSKSHDYYGALAYEAASPIFISANQGPMLFINNTFSENIGLHGGAIEILTPNYAVHSSSDYETAGLPVIIMENNNFTRNMAYMSGNAFFIINTYRLAVPYEDHLRMCGAGILIENNHFQGNIGMKRHHGGAGYIGCEWESYDYEMFYLNNGIDAGLPLKERNATKEEL